jgi:hypothetical protein
VRIASPHRAVDFLALCFADFELDRERQQLLRSGRPVPLEPKAYEAGDGH